MSEVYYPATHLLTEGFQDHFSLRFVNNFFLSTFVTNYTLVHIPLEQAELPKNLRDIHERFEVNVVGLPAELFAIYYGKGHIEDLLIRSTPTAAHLALDYVAKGRHL